MKFTTVVNKSIKIAEIFSKNVCNNLLLYPGIKIERLRKKTEEKIK